MTYADDRTLRKEVYRAFTTRASGQADQVDALLRHSGLAA